MHVVIVVWREMFDDDGGEYGCGGYRTSGQCLLHIVKTIQLYERVTFECLNLDQMHVSLCVKYINCQRCNRNCFAGFRSFARFISVCFFDLN